MDQAPQRPRMPWFLTTAIRFGTSPAEWPDALACYERVFTALVAAEGSDKARRWARKEAVWLVVAGVSDWF